MAKKAGPGRPKTQVETVPVKIKKEDYLLVRTIASWRDTTALEYLSEIIREATAKDLPEIQRQMAKASGGGK